MKTIIHSLSAAILFILIFGNITSYGQQSNDPRISFTVNAGVGIPVAPVMFSENWHAGPGIEAGIGYRLSSSSLVQVNASYHNFGFNSGGFRGFQNLPSGTEISSSNAEVMTLALNGLFEYHREDTNLIPYAKAGLGLFRYLPRDIRYSMPDGRETFTSETETSLMVNAAGGFLMPLRGNISLFVEAKFVTGLFVQRRTQFLPISLGIRF